MATRNWFVLASAVSVLAIGALGARTALAQAGARVDKVSKSSFDATVKKVETALQANGMMIVARVDHQNMLSMVGAKIGGSKTIEFGKPDMGKMVFSADPAAGLEMPGKLYVFERSDGKVVVSYYKPSAGFGGYGKDDLNKVGMMMDEMLDKISTEATQ
jgi:uncharacterized protein (DUF302 family)